MTTTVILKTHEWPCAVTTTDTTNVTSTGVTEKHVHVQTIPPNWEHSFYLTDTRELSFRELPKPKAD